MSSNKNSVFDRVGSLGVVTSPCRPAALYSAAQTSGTASVDMAVSAVAFEGKNAFMAQHIKQLAALSGVCCLPKNGRTREGVMPAA
jgi:hypothetical protein